nr:FKBP-type peptidyl-prolyl cis-trans isomerase [Desulfococcus multivorans]
MTKVSYILGRSIAGDFKRQSIDIEVDSFVDGFRGAAAGEPSRIRVAEMQQIMEGFKNAFQERRQTETSGRAEANLEKGRVFLTENRERAGVVETESGLQYRVIREGSGKTPSASDTVETHYEGRTIDGNIFDSSVKRGKPATFPVNGVIRGWQEALQLMSEGAKYELFIPSDLAYGPGGAGNAIGPHETLIFEVELLKIV